MNKSRWATGVFAGAIIGAAAALLLSPRGGKENRQALTTLGSKTGDIKQRAGGYIGNIREKFRRDTGEESDEPVGTPSGNGVQTHD